MSQMVCLSQTGIVLFRDDQNREPIHLLAAFASFYLGLALFFIKFLVVSILMFC